MREISFRGLVAIIAIAACCSVVEAQPLGLTSRLDTSPAKDSAREAEPFTIFRTYVLGDDRVFDRIGLTATGNLVELVATEGGPDLIVSNTYAVCYQAAGTETIAFDDGRTAVNFGPVEIREPSGPGELPITFTRLTADGLLELHRSYQVNRARSEVIVQMALRSRGSLENVRIKDLLDADFIGGDNIGRTADAVFLWGDLIATPPLGAHMISYRGDNVEGPWHGGGFIPDPGSPNIDCDLDDLLGPSLSLDAGMSMVFDIGRVVPQVPQKRHVRLRRE
jgi:hypothetical protein